ncbi:MAG: TrmH family RNA methyltransferase [Nannocystaceae bacterium]|nr:TrmH family RNA methyltransferase [bacterium]
MAEDGGFMHVRHKPGTPLDRPRELVVACVPMRSNVNVSQIARTASAVGAQRLILTGAAKLINKIARDGAEALPLSVHRTLPPVLARLKADGYRLVGLEQTTGSVSLYTHAFERRTALVVGNERLGLSDEVLAMLDDVVEIPVYGMPHSYNAAIATSIALYEYCRQFPRG